MLGAGEGVICHQIRRYRDRRGDVVALLVRLHIADRILRRGGNIIRLVSMCCFVVLADDSKTAVQRRGLLGLHRRLGAVNRDIGKRFLVAFFGNFPVVSVIEKRNRNGRGVFRSACVGRRCVIPVVCRYIWCYREIHRAEPVLVNRICAARVKRTHEVGEIFGAVICRHCAVDLCNGQAKQIVLRGRVRFVYGRGLLAVLNLDHTQAVVQYPLVILVADYKPQRCLARIVELMRLRFFAVVLCDIRRGLDGHVVFPRLIQSRRFRPVERLVLRVVDQVVVFRPAAGGADVLYLNLPDSRFQIVIGGNRNKRGLRSALFPDGVDGLGAVCMFNGDLAARLILRISRSRTVSPALEGAAFLGRDLIADGKGNLVHRWMRCRTRLTIRRTGAAIRIILQFKEWHPDGVDGLGRIVLGQCDRLSARVLRSRSIRLVRPANVLIATAVLQLRSINIKREGGRLRGPIRYFREPSTVRAVVILIIQIVHVGRSGGCTLKIIVSSVLTIDKERGAAFTSFVAATASPRNVVNLIVVYTFPDVLGIRKSERIVVDVVLAKINRDVIAADCTYRMAADCITDLDFHAGDSAVHRRMQHDRAITRRHRRHRQHAEHHNQN